MRRSMFLCISPSWRPHSELIQGWIAGASSEPRQLQQARSYMYGLQLEAVLEEVEDATDLVYFMHRVSYPAGSHLEARVGDFLAAAAAQCTREDLLAVTRRLQEAPAAGPLWARVLLARPWLAERLPALLNGLSLDEHIAVAAAVWQALLRSQRDAPCPTPTTTGAAQQLAALTAQRLTRDKTGQGVCLCAKLGIPLSEESLVAMRTLILAQTRNGLNATQLGEVAEALAAQRSSDTEWIEALQMAICQNPITSIEAQHAVSILHAIAMVPDTPVYVGFEKLLVRLLPDMSVEARLSCCESLAVLSGVAHGLRDKLRTTLYSAVSKFIKREYKECNDDMILRQLRALSLIASKEAKVLLLELANNMKESKHILSPTATQNLIRSMWELQEFPPELVSQCKSSFLQNTLMSFSQEDAAYLLYAAAYAGEPADGIFFRDALNRFVTTRKFDRRRNRTQQINILPILTVIMVLRTFSVAKGGQLTTESKVYSMVRDAVEYHQRQGVITVEDAITILRLLVQLKVVDASLTTVLLTGLSKSISSMTAVQASGLCDVLVALKSRDVLMFRALLSRLVKLHPDHVCITKIAFAARRLKFIPYFQQSALVSQITSLHGWSVSDIVLVASACDKKQREDLLSLPGSEILAKASAEEMTTVDLFLLLSITHGDEPRLVAMTETLKTRPPIAAGDLEVEDAWRAVANVVSNTESLATVCRSCAATLQSVDENMLMRVLEVALTAPKLPNIFFRVVGKSVLRLANSMAIENALRWLQLYVNCQIRDDSVGKALLAKTRTRSNYAAGITDKTIRKAAAMYGKSYTFQPKVKKHQEKVEWYPLGSI
ncbi:uncharacterized protein TM35_000013590 [Trypanosoma theileri]|uniref:Uncharacterized protein n=1 Tax=Trypanosoma theileri TaxID=67003 RepID=A0A1X0P977_9TRYP|nr:uncharacterized protein TM35_000013590 [Trypanosoma theileri]ORC93482.1 hypothetical protein TM35_000013590 [Trypanosoma theileri]